MVFVGHPLARMPSQRAAAHVEPGEVPIRALASVRRATLEKKQQEAAAAEAAAAAAAAAAGPKEPSAPKPPAPPPFVPPWPPWEDVKHGFFQPVKVRNDLFAGLIFCCCFGLLCPLILLL